MEDRHIFDSTVEGKRRSVLFALALTSAVIGVVAATSTLLATGENLMAVLGLLTSSVLLIAFAMAVYLGYFEGLIADRQLMWQLFEVEEE